MTGESWSATRRAQESIQAVGEAVAEEFGEPAKENTAGPLSRGYIVTRLDDATKAVVVVVDPEVVDPQRLTEKLVSASGVGGLSVRVEPGAFTVAELLEADAVLKERAWHPRAAQITFAAYLAADSRFVVTLRSEDDDVARALVDRLGGRVRIEWGAPGRRPRHTP